MPLVFASFVTLQLDAIVLIFPWRYIELSWRISSYSGRCYVTSGL